MRPPPYSLATRPAALGPGETSDPTDAVHLDLSTTELREAAGTLARLLRGIATWSEGGGPVRVQHRGQVRSEALRAAIACLQCLLKSPTSAELRPEIAFECRQAVHPLERHGALWTATAFAEAACLLVPREPWHVVEVARLARLRERPEAAWATYLWAARLAREERMPGALCAVALEAAILARSEDRHALAGRLLSLCARYARRHGRPAFEGHAWAELGTLRHELGHTDEALTHFGAAVRGYGEGSKNLLMLGYRMGLCWLDEGQFQAALHVLMPLRERITGIRRPMTLAAIARASAALGRRNTFEYAWNATWALIYQTDDYGGGAALLQLIRAAAIRRDWPRTKSLILPAGFMALAAGDAGLRQDAANMAGLLKLPRRKLSREALEEAFPDVARLRLGTGERWDVHEPSDPWQTSHAIRTVVEDFLRAVEACPLAPGFAGAP